MSQKIENDGDYKRNEMQHHHINMSETIGSQSNSEYNPKNLQILLNKNVNQKFLDQQPPIFHAIQNKIVN